MELVQFIHSLWIFGFIFIINFSLTSGMSLNADPDKPALGNNMTVTCQRSNSSNSSINWDIDSSFLTFCDVSTIDFCNPSPPLEYTYSSDGSENEFELTRDTITLTDCKTYTCIDHDNSESISKDIYVAYYSKNDISATEPGANTDGYISITTGCVLSPDDLTIIWTKIVNGNSVALSVGDPSPVTSTNRSTCTRTCHTEEDKKVTSGFTHTEYTGPGTDFVTVQYMVSVSHSSYQDNADIYTWTSSNYILKKDGLKCWIKIFLVCLISYLCGSFVIGISLGLILVKTSCCCDCFYEGESCKDCVNNHYCQCECCASTPCGACGNIEGLPHWYQVLQASIIGIPVALGIRSVWICLGKVIKPGSKYSETMEEWMTNLPDQATARPLTLLAIPGSHDSGTARLDPSLGVMSESCLLDFFSSCIQSIIRNWAKTQDLSITAQLKAGIRYFDLRVACRPGTNEVRVVHTLYGRLVTDELADVNSFLANHPKEVVILDFNHFYNMNAKTHNQLLGNLSTIFVGKCTPPPPPNNMWTLKDLWNNKQQVISLYNAIIPEEHVQEVWPANKINSPWANTESLETLLHFHDEKYKDVLKNGYDINQFYVWQGLLTPKDETTVRQCCSTYRDYMSLPATEAFVNWLEEKEKITICIVDFVDNNGFIQEVVTKNNVEQ